MIVAAVLAFASVTYVSIDQRGVRKADAAAAGATAAPTYAAIEPILTRHCTGCHSVRPTNPAVSAPPLGVVFDSYAHVRALAPRIKMVAVDSQVMPLGNPTGMTLAERRALGAWIAAGTPP